MLFEDRYAISGIILAGGKSLRMGENKALIQIDGIPIIERIHMLFKNLFQEVLIITNETDLFHFLKAKKHKDLIPGAGAMGGLFTGLSLSSFRYAFVAACDMPFLNPEVIRYLIQCKGEYDVVVPKTRKGFEPLHALYSKKCLNPIEQCLLDRKKRILDMFSHVLVRTIEPDEIVPLDPQLKTFININTPQDLVRYLP